MKDFDREFQEAMAEADRSFNEYTTKVMRHFVIGLCVCAVVLAAIVYFSRFY